MATANIGVTTGTVSAPAHLPVDADGTALNSNLAATTGTTAALTGDLDSLQSIAWTVNSFEALNMFVGIMANVWSCTGRTAGVRLQKMLNDYLAAPNPQPTGG